MGISYFLIKNVICNYCFTLKVLGSLKICSGDCEVIEEHEILTNGHKVKRDDHSLC